MHSFAAMPLSEKQENEIILSLNTEYFLSLGSARSHLKRQEYLEAFQSAALSLGLQNEQGHLLTKRIALTALSALASSHLQNADYASASPYLQLAIVLDNKNENLQHALSRCEHVIKPCDSLRNVFTLFFKSQQHYNQGSYIEAINALRTAMHFLPFDDNLLTTPLKQFACKFKEKLTSLAITAMRTNNYFNANHYLELALTIEPADLQAHSLIEKCNKILAAIDHQITLAMPQDLDQKLACLKKAQETCIDHPILLKLIDQALEDKKQSLLIARTSIDNAVFQAFNGYRDAHPNKNLEIDENKIGLLKEQLLKALCKDWLFSSLANLLVNHAAKEHYQRYLTNAFATLIQQHLSHAIISFHTTSINLFNVNDLLKKVPSTLANFIESMTRNAIAKNNIETESGLEKDLGELQNELDLTVRHLQPPRLTGYLLDDLKVPHLAEKALEPIRRPALPFFASQTRKTDKPESFAEVRHQTCFQMSKP